MSTSAKPACLALETSWKPPWSQSATCQGLIRTLNWGLVSKCCLLQYLPTSVVPKPTLVSAHYCNEKIQAVERQLRDYVIHGNMSVISNFTLECQDIPHPWRYKIGLLLFWHEQIIALFRAHIPHVVCKRICVCACRYFPAITQLLMSFFWTLVFAPIGICYLNSSFVSFFCYRVIHVSVVFVFLFKTILIL